MSKPLTNEQIESIKQEMYEFGCDLEAVIYVFIMILMNVQFENDYRSITFYQGIVDYLTYPQKGI